MFSLVVVKHVEEIHKVFPECIVRTIHEKNLKGKELWIVFTAFWVIFDGEFQQISSEKKLQMLWKFRKKLIKKLAWS